MSPTTRIWFWSVVAALAAVAGVQGYDAAMWATGPWLGFTLGEHGLIVYRTLAELPPGLRPLAEAGPVHLAAVQAGGVWHRLPGFETLPDYEGRPRAAYAALRSRLAGLAVGTPVRLRVLDPSFALVEVPARVGRVPPSVVAERCGLYTGMGLLSAAFGCFVFYARPGSVQALAFAVFSVSFGVELLTCQVVGGFPSRFHALSLAASFIMPAAAMSLAFVLEPRPWFQQRSWVISVPWLLALVSVIGAAVHGSLAEDPNPFVRAFRMAMWALFAGYVLWMRITASSRAQARRLEVYLGGFAVAFALPTFYYALPMAPGDLPSPYVMASLLVFPGVVGYGILRYGLFDVEVILRRGVAFTAVTLVVAAAYGAAALAVHELAGPEAMSPLKTAVLAGFAVLVGGALRARLQRLVDRGLNPERFGYLEALRRASGRMAGLTDVEEVARSLVEVATGVAGLSGAAVYLERDERLELVTRGGDIRTGPGAPLDREDAMVRLVAALPGGVRRQDFESNPRFVPLRARCMERFDALGAELAMPLAEETGRLVGLAVLGARRDGRPLNSEDLDVLSTLVNQAALAIARARQAPAVPVEPAIPSRAPLGEGLSIGHYRLERSLGSGGAGTVWQATDTDLGRPVALKFLREDSTHPAQGERLLREARVLATLNHPNLVQIHALERLGGHVFLACELVDGGNLADELARRGRFPPAEAAVVVVDVAQALDYALARGVIHRDVKLQNIMRTAQGSIKLIDFGLAKASTADTGLTSAGLVVGTILYLAPELLGGEPASVRSDLYALGVVLELLLTGPPGMPGGPHLRRGTGVDAGSLRRRGVPEPLVGPLLRLLDPEPAGRYEQYATLIADLRRAAARL